MSKMKVVTKNNLLTLVSWKQEYENKKSKGYEDKELLLKINNYINNVINKDNEYFHKLSSYNFDKEITQYLIV